MNKGRVAGLTCTYV